MQRPALQKFSPRLRWESLSLESTCNDKVTLLSKAKYVSATSLIGIPGLAVYNTCKPSTAISLLNHEQRELRSAILDNRAGLDYLLLCSHIGCESFNNLCCFNLSDNSHAVNNQLGQLTQLANNISQDILPSWWDSLWSRLRTVLILKSANSSGLVPYSNQIQQLIPASRGKFQKNKAPNSSLLGSISDQVQQPIQTSSVQLLNKSSS